MLGGEALELVADFVQPLVEQFGGAGLSVLGQCVVQEEAAQCRMGAFFPALGAFGGNPPSAVRAGRLGLPLALAKGTSLLVIVPTAVVGTLRNRASGLTEVRAGVVVGTAGIVSAFLASRLSLTLDPRLSAGLFAALLVVVAARLVVTARATAPAPAPAADAFGGGD